MEPCEQTVEGDEAGLAREDAVEPCPQGGLALRGRMLAIGFEIAIEPPDQRARSALSLALFIREGVELVNEALEVKLLISLVAEAVACERVSC